MMKRYYFWPIFICLIIGCISFFSSVFVNGQAASGRIEVNGADTQLAVGLEASTPSGWQFHPIIVAASRGDAAQNYLLNSQLILNFFNEVGQSNAVVADVIVQNADLTRRYDFGVHPVSDLSAPVPRMQIIVSRADEARHAGLSLPVLLGGNTPTPTATSTSTNEPTRVVNIATPSPTATRIPAGNTSAPTDTPTLLPPGTTPIPPHSGDAYETDGLCSQAKPLPVDDGFQEYTFHQEGDEDWTTFELQGGVKYLFFANSTSPDARPEIELYLLCDDLPESSIPNLGNDAELIFTAPTSGRYYARVRNDDSRIFGADVTYQLSLVTQSTSNDLAIIITGHDDDKILQENIFNSANRAYRTFLSRGISKTRIRYLGLMDNVGGDERGDADHDGRSDIDTEATVKNIKNVITEWAADLADSESRVFIYMIDHGLVDYMIVNGNEDLLKVEQLDNWLNQLESATNTSMAVIYEACLSGSFITGVKSISKSGRIVITSTDDETNAFPMLGAGAHFSDAFFSALRQGENIYDAFHEGKDASAQTQLNQRPMLDDNGDYKYNRRDGELARSWRLEGGFSVTSEYPTFSTPKGPEPQDIVAGRGVIEVSATLPSSIKEVWAVVYRPDFVEPTRTEDGIMPELVLDRVEFSDNDEDGNYVGLYDNFTLDGIYRFVIYGLDHSGNMIFPSTMEMEVGLTELDGTSESLVKRIYLPLISR